MTTLSFTRQDLAEAVNATVARAKTDRQHECIEHASAWLAKFEGSKWVLKAEYLIIKSESSDRMYTLTLGDTPHCNCPALKPCWHLAIAVIIRAANQLHEDHEALDYGVWYPNCRECGGQGCHLCMVTVEPAFAPARAELAPAIITNEADLECIPW